MDMLEQIINNGHAIRPIKKLFDLGVVIGEAA